MKTSVQSISEVQVKLEVELPAADVDKEYRRQLAAVARQARIKGFRPGKAPKSMVKKLYGSRVAEDTTRVLINKSLEEALGTLGDRSPIGQPSVEPGLAREGHPLKYAIRVEVKPEVEIKDWEAIEVAVADATVTAEDVDREIQQLRERHKERVPVEDRGADTGDLVVVSTTGSIEGEPDDRLTTTDMEVKIGAGQMIPGFEDQLMGAEAGGSKTIEVVFPEDYHAADLAGKGAVFEAEITQVFTEELPELDDDFAQDVGHDTLDALTESVNKRLQNQRDRSRREEIERRVVAVMLERNKFQVPPAMVRAQFESSAQRMLMLLQMQGMPRDQAVNMVEQNVDGMSRQAQDAVRRYLALEALAKQQEIVIDDDEVNAEVIKKIEAEGERAGKRYEAEDAREQLRLELRERATLDLLIERAKISSAQPAPEAAEEPAEEPAPEPADEPAEDASESEE